MTSLSADEFSQLLVHASLDYVFLLLPKQSPPRPLARRFNWPKSALDEMATIQDPTFAKLSLLGATCRWALELVEVEVSVDFRPRPQVTGQHRIDLLERVMVDVFARGLLPRAQDLSTTFRAVYMPGKRSPIRGFNLRLPAPGDQQPHGGKYDVLQVKAYLKTGDQRKVLPLQRWTARVETRLEDQALRARGCALLQDLFTVDYRRVLMPLFTHVSGVCCRTSSLPRSAAPYLAPGLTTIYRDKFKRSGVGALVGQGATPEQVARVRFLRHTEVNKRIGDALHRLALAAQKTARLQSLVSTA